MKIILKNNKRQQSKLKLKVIKILIGIAIFFCLSIPFVYIVSITLAKVAVIEFILAVMPQEKLSGINILAFGVDETEYVQRADSIIVCHINEENNRMGILSIPRDTRVHVSGYGLTKINHAHAFGGVDLLKKSVSDFLGVPIDYYIKVNLNGVEKVIDKIGGVVVNIPKDLFYVDYAGDLYIDLKKGQQRLTGKEAVQFLRFRHDADGDYGRIARQQTFIKALVSKVTKSGKLFEMPLLFAKLSSNIKTNLGLAQMVGFATQCKDIFDAGNIEIATVPGAPILYKGVSYLRPDIVAMDNLIKETLFGFEKEKIFSEDKIETQDQDASKQDRRGLTVKEISRIISNTDQSDSPFNRLSKEMKIEVLNGCGVDGVATKVTNQLRGYGLKVIKIGNAGSFDYPKTLIVDWKGKHANAIALAQALSIDPSNIIVYDRPEKPLNITLVIGKNGINIED